MPHHSASAPAAGPTPGHGRGSRAPDVASAAVVLGSEKNLNSDSTPTDSDSTGESDFKEGGYGWVVVASVFLVNAHTWGLNSSYAVFLAYYLRSGTISGASPLAFAFVGGLSISIALLVSPLATLSIGRLGTNATLRLGTVLEAVSFIGASFATHTWHLLLSQGVCFGMGLGFCFTATVGVVPQWFTKRRSFANAISTGGSGFGGLVYSLATDAMIRNLGLAWSFRILAVISFVVNGACTLTLRDRNKAVGAIHIAFHVDLLRRPEFLLYIGWGFFAIISYVIVVFSLADYAHMMGFDPSQGSVVAAVFNLSQGLGRPLIGLVSDKVGRINIAAMGTLISAITTFFIWTFAGRFYPGLIIYALFGMFCGTIWPCVAPVGAEVVGLQLLPSALSLYWLVLVLPSTFAEVIGLSLRTSGTNGYINVQVFVGALYCVSFASIWLLRSWKVQQMDALGLTRNNQAADGQDAQAIDGLSERMQQPSLVRSYIDGMFVIKRV